MARYLASFLKPAGPGDARPTALQIVQDENLLGKLVDKVMLVTGTSSGIGIETVRALHATRATVFATVRNVPKGQAVVDEILGADPGNTAPIHLIEMDLNSLESVRRGAKQVLAQTDKLNVVINNAGVMATPQGTTADGYETQFGTNHLAHFLLFQLLKPLLIQSASPAFPSRVVNVSSIGHRSGGIRFDDYHFRNSAGTYNPWLAYGQAKTANILMANEIERRYGADTQHPLHATSVHPGGIVTGLAAHLGDMNARGMQDPEQYKWLSSPAQGAATQVYAALSAEWRDKGGKFLSFCNEAEPYKGDPSATLKDGGYQTWAYDEQAEKRLWKDSCEMVNIADD